MSSKHEPLKLGKGWAFVKTRLKRLPQEDETWEADFRALPKPMTQSATKYLGMVVTEPHGFLLASLHVEGRPSVNDLAKLLADAMRRPDGGSPHLPKRILLRGHPQWGYIFRHLSELGIDLDIELDLPQFDEAYDDYLRLVGEDKRKDMVKPTSEQMQVENLFPAMTKWVNGGYGHIEIGDQEGFGFIARALDYGGLVFEDEKSRTLAESMAVLEKELVRWFEEYEQG